MTGAVVVNEVILQKIGLAPSETIKLPWVFRSFD